MNRITLSVVLVLVSGCVRAVPPVALAPAPVTLPAEIEAPSRSAIAEVEAVLNDVTVRFEFDSDLLDPQAMVSLQKLAKVLRRNKLVSIVIAGNCDERGTEEYNMFLAQRRAESARQYLTLLGVTDTQLDTISYGSEKPLSSEKTDEAYSLNRRDDVSVKPSGSVASFSSRALRGPQE
ncbi:MAG: OmpA family protein [Myxococcales bacterium]|nr:OmpA family protein [Myxococcales bacterium]MDP3501351.1 OmpA family protein [Myxococcales bacterium]